MLNELIKIKGGFVRAVKISDDFFDEELNRRKLESYYVNPSAREAFYSISKGLHPISRNRVHLISGTYGSGKSHFGLVIANYLTKNSGSKDLEMIFHRIREKDPSKADEIYRIRNIDRPYLIILLEGHDLDGAEHFLLKGLKDALTRDGVPEEVLKTSYQSALRKIEEWENRKLAFVEQMSQSLDKKGGNIATINDLKEHLNLFKEDAYRLFKEIHSEVTLSSFEPLYHEKASQIYLQLSKLLIKEYGRKGIVIIWDQFDEHVRNMRQSDLGREESFLRNFVEIIERSGENQLHLILISHHLPHEYLRGVISEEALHNWERIEGRFQQLLLEAIKESEELIDYAITQQRETEQWKEVENNIEKGTRLIGGVVKLGLFPEKDRNWVINTICKGAFPLHPIATYCLPRISDVVGQAERTMFTFFEEEIKEGGLTKFINENPPIQEGKLKFYTADKLFDFFNEAIESIPETRHVVKNYAEAMSKVKDPREVLTQRVMKALAVIKTIKTNHPAIPLLATLSNLSLLLNIDEYRVRSLLGSLFENQVLWIRANSEYDFRTGQAIVDFGEDFAKAREELRWDNPILELKSYCSPIDIGATGYEKDYWVTRKLFADYIDVGGLDNIKQYEKQIKYEFKDGFVLYVLAESEREIDETKGKAINIKNPQIVITVPKRPLKIYSPLKNLRALELLKRKQAYAAEDTEAYHMWKDKYESEKQKLDDEVRNWKEVGNLYWFSGGETLDTVSKKDTDIADSVMYRVFDKTPIVEHRRMANRWEQDQRSDRIKLNTAILDVKREEIEYQAKGRAPAEKTILEQTFDPQRMLRKRIQGNFDYYQFIEPRDGNMKEVWDLMKKYLMESGPYANFEKLIKELQLPPYGLSPRVVELFLSAFLRFYRNHFTIKAKRAKHASWEKKEFIGDTINEIVNIFDLEKVVIEYREQLPLEDDFLLIVNSIISPQKPWESKLSPIEGVGELFVEWHQGLPIVTKCAIDLGNNTKKFLQEIGDVKKDMDMRELLLEKLPFCLGIEKGFSIWDKEDLENFENLFKGVVDDLNQYPDKVKRKTVSCFVEVFDVKKDTKFDVIEKIKNWYGELDPSVKQAPLTGSSFKLRKYADIERADQFEFEQKFLIELPKELGFKEYTKWENADEIIQKYKGALLKAKAEIEKLHFKATKKHISKPPKLSEQAESLKASLKKKIQKAGIKKEEIVMLLEELLKEYGK